MLMLRNTWVDNIGDVLQFYVAGSYGGIAEFNPTPKMRIQGANGNVTIGNNHTLHNGQRLTLNNYTGNLSGTCAIDIDVPLSNFWRGTTPNKGTAPTAVRIETRSTRSDNYEDAALDFWICVDPLSGIGGDGSLRKRLSLERGGAFIFDLAGSSATAVTSDRRIKKNITDLDDYECLNKLRLLKPCKYQYIKDINLTRSDLDNYVYGFIAQEVEEVIPYSTHKHTYYIPLLEHIEVNIVEFKNIKTDICSNDIGEIYIKGICNKILDLSGIENIGILYDGIPTLCKIIDKNYHTNEINMLYTGTNFINDMSGNLYITNTEVNDFNYLKKDAIWTVATSALQEIDRIQQRHEQEIIELKSKYDALLSRLEALEQQ